MIENLMYFGLGALIAGLLTLLFLPIFWRRALRLSTRSLQMQLPLSMTEIIAERDQLRAEFAIEQRRIEKRAEDIATARARDMAELGRRASHIARLEAELVEVWRQSEDRAERLTKLGEDLNAARVELGAAHQLHWDAEGRYENKQRELDAMDARRQAMLDLADERRAMIAGLETRLEARAAEIEDLRVSLEESKRQSLDLSRALLAEEEEHHATRASLEAMSARSEQALEQIREARERALDFETQHRAERRARMRFESELAMRTSALSIAETREASLRQAHSEELAIARAGDKTLLQRIEDLRSENAALKGALEASRREPPERPHPVVEAKPVVEPDAELETLRRAISEVGARIELLVEQRERQPVAGAAE